MKALIQNKILRFKGGIKNFVLTLFIFTIHFSASQQTEIHGKIFSKDDQKLLTDVQVRSDDGYFSFSDSSGNFKINISEKTAYISFSLIGFQKKNVYIKNIDSKNKIAIYLDADIQQLQDLVVSAAKREQKISDVTVSVNILKPKLIEATNTVKFDAVLEQIPGVTIINGQANIRGTSGFSYGAGSRVMMLLNGLPMLSADAGDIKFDAIPLENISQIEVIKGASSALYGAGALGGVVNLRTAWSDKDETKIQSFYSLYNSPKNITHKWWSGNQSQDGFSISHSIKKEKTDFNIGIYKFVDDGYRQGETYDNKRVNFAFRFHDIKKEKYEAGFYTTIFESKFGNFLWWKNVDSPLVPASGTLSLNHTYRYTFDPYLIYNSSKTLRQSLKGRVYITNNTGVSSQSSLGELFFAEYQIQKDFMFSTRKKMSVTSGINTTQNIVKSDSFYGNHIGKNAAIYCQADGKWLYTSYSFGIRIEANKIDSQTTKYFPVFRGGISQQIAKGTYIRTSYGTGYRFPSVAERYITTQVSSLKVFPNQNIQPETGYSFEFALRQEFKIKTWRGFFDAARYVTNYTNMVNFVFGIYPPPNYTGPTFPYLGFKSLNQNKHADISGYDINIFAEGKIGKIFSTLNIGYTFTEPLYSDSVFNSDSLAKNSYYNRMTYRFRHTWKANADFIYKKFTIGLSWRYNSNMLNTDLFLNIAIPGLSNYRLANNSGYHIFDFRVAYNLQKNLKCSFIIKNILNNEYMNFPGNTGAPRIFTVQLNWIIK